MENKYSNYDMFDTLIANNRKAKSWTVFWVIALCILAGFVIALAIVNSRQKRAIADLNLSAEYKSRVIDSLKSILEKDVNKKVDSIEGYISTINSGLKKIQEDYNKTGTVADVAEQVNQKENFKVVDNSIRELNNQVQQIKTDFRKDKLRFFIQYNNAADIEQINKLSGYLKRNDNYFVAPAELVKDIYPNLIKIYNYNNKDEEMKLKEIISRIFNLTPNDIGLAHITSNPEVSKPTIEIWLSSSQIKPKMAH